ncbi:MAG: hypothetical protein NVSMB57_12800 [Actinomycetota bacterium]
MALNANELQFVALAGVALAGGSAAVAFRASSRLDKMRRTLGVLQGAGGEGPRDADLAADIVGTVRRLDRENGELFAGVRQCLQNVGLVRFDAFEDMGGRLSFCAALLDIDGNGLVITSITGRTETRMYAKPVERGSSKYHLSDEEQGAIRRALGEESAIQIAKGAAKDAARGSTATGPLTGTKEIPPTGPLIDPPRDRP